MQPPHALVLPFPLQGHISPLLQLSEHLASSHGFLITFVNTEYIHTRHYTADKSNGSAATGRNDNVRLVGLSDGLPLNAERKPSDMQDVMRSMPLHMKPLLEELITGSIPPVSCIIADIFMPWVHAAAEAANAPLVIGFHVSSIAQFSLIYHIPLLVSSGQIAEADGSPKAAIKKISGVPGLFDMDVANIPWCGGHPKQNEGLFMFLRSVQKHLGLCKAILFNSFNDLERETVDAITADNPHMMMLPVGPLLLRREVAVAHSQLESGTGHHASPATGTESSLKDEECVDWLNTQARSSVLYISFGTTAWLSTHELHELALGLEASRAPFLWVIRADLVMGETAILPEGFTERTKGRAYFTSWAPQTLVLSHPCVGGFLTHGGWNSAIEAIAMGVPMLTWPYAFDQKGNCQLLVEQLKVGLALRRSSNGEAHMVRREEVEKLVGCLMKGVQGQEIRERVVDLQSKASLAVSTEQGGPSHINVLKLIRFLSHG